MNFGEFIKGAKTVVITPALAVLISCAGFPSENHDPAKNNKATYNQELQECKEDYPEVGSGVHIRQWVNCMKLKGWN
jgi:hypothetical protein